MIDELTTHYMPWCGQLNVGMFRDETLEMRRVSQTTGRLVPLFKAREYDDHRYPVRKLPEIVSRNLDNSGLTVLCGMVRASNLIPILWYN